MTRIGTNAKKNYSERVHDKKGYMTKKCTHPKSNNMDTVHNEKGTHPESNYMERAHDTKRYTP